MLGKFITFEGGEGTGKSTQIELLSQYLTSKNIDHIITKEPGGTEIGKEIRRILLTKRVEELDPISEALLYYADRAHHVRSKILPALEKGIWVLSDRFADSTKAYQFYGYNKKISRELLDELYQIAVGDLKPDLTLILDIDPKIGLKRSLNKAETMEIKETHFELKELEFHNNLRNGFLEIAKAEPSRCKVLEADVSIEELHRKIVEAVNV